MSIDTDRVCNQKRLLVEPCRVNVSFLASSESPLNGSFWAGSGSRQFGRPAKCTSAVKCNSEGLLSLTHSEFPTSQAQDRQPFPFALDIRTNTAWNFRSHGGKPRS
jgi:hypothetical protein